jgi:hypothetical protein
MSWVAPAAALKSWPCWLWSWNSYLLSCRIPHFSRQKFFCFSDFRIWLLNGQNEIMLVEDLENFPFWIVFWCFRDPSILLPLRNPLSEWKIHKNFRQKPRPRPAYCARSGVISAFFSSNFSFFFTRSRRQIHRHSLSFNDFPDKSSIRDSVSLVGRFCRQIQGQNGLAHGAWRGW